MELTGLFIGTTANLSHDSERTSVEVIPRGTYLSMCRTEFEPEKRYAMALPEEVKKRRYQINGDCIGEVISEFPKKQGRQKQLFCKIRIRVC